jgi:secondary thiamine-phosphate synthase enzyme
MPEDAMVLKMMNLEIERTFATKAVLDFVDVTDDVREAVASSGVSDGRVTLFSKSSSCTLLANERESGLLKDIRRAVDKLGAAGTSKDHLHIGASSIVVPLVGGSLRLGTWQRLLLAELEGPSERSVLIQIVGE